MTAGWVDNFRFAINKANDEVWTKNFLLRRTDLSELDLKTYRDIYWPDAILYFESLRSLAYGIYIYAPNIEKLSSWYDPILSTASTIDQQRNDQDRSAEHIASDTGIKKQHLSSRRSKTLKRDLRSHILGKQYVI